MGGWEDTGKSQSSFGSSADYITYFTIHLRSNFCCKPLQACQGLWLMAYCLASSSGSEGAAASDDGIRYSLGCSSEELQCEERNINFVCICTYICLYVYMYICIYVLIDLYTYIYIYSFFVYLFILLVKYIVQHRKPFDKHFWQNLYDGRLRR